LHRSPASVRVLLFSVLREKLGVKELEIPLNDSTTVADLLRQLSDLSPEISLYSGMIRVAVNQVYVDEQATVRPGDEVALITPVSGG